MSTPNPNYTAAASTTATATAASSAISAVATAVALDKKSLAEMITSHPFYKDIDGNAANQQLSAALVVFIKALQNVFSSTVRNEYRTQALEKAFILRKSSREKEAFTLSYDHNFFSFIQDGFKRYYWAIEHAIIKIQIDTDKPAESGFVLIRADGSQSAPVKTVDELFQMMMRVRIEKLHLTGLDAAEAAADDAHAIGSHHVVFPRITQERLMNITPTFMGVAAASQLSAPPNATDAKAIAEVSRTKPAVAESLEDSIAKQVELKLQDQVAKLPELARIKKQTNTIVQVLIEHPTLNFKKIIPKEQLEKVKIILNILNLKTPYSCPEVGEAAVGFIQTAIMTIPSQETPPLMLSGAAVKASTAAAPASSVPDAVAAQPANTPVPATDTAAANAPVTLVISVTPPAAGTGINVGANVGNTGKPNAMKG